MQETAVPGQDNFGRTIVSSFVTLAHSGPHQALGKIENQINNRTFLRKEAEKC
jgi:hypothetical protein